MADTSAIVAALARQDPIEAVYQALRGMAYDLLDLKQFTMMTVDRNRGVARRVFSDDTEAYPVAGEKPVLDNAWTKTVLVGRQTFVGNSIKELAEVFPDWEKIQSLGLESCLNLPIVVNDEVIGTLNCLSVAGHFTPPRVEAAEQLKLPGAVAFLLARQNPGRQT